MTFRPLRWLGLVPVAVITAGSLALHRARLDGAMLGSPLMLAVWLLALGFVVVQMTLAWRQRPYRVYPWGVPNISPSEYIAAWRHVHDVFASAGAVNVTWVWQMSTLQGSHTLPQVLSSLWPGARCVAMVGLDGYFYEAGANFASVFGVTIREIRQITSDPMLITETAAGTDIGQAAKVSELFAGIRTWHLLGLVWFDRNQAPHHATRYRQDWQLDGNPAALRVFRDDARAYLKQAGPQ